LPIDKNNILCGDIITVADIENQEHGGKFFLCDINSGHYFNKSILSVIDNVPAGNKPIAADKIMSLIDEGKRAWAKRLSAKKELSRASGAPDSSYIAGLWASDKGQPLYSGKSVSLRTADEPLFFRSIAFNAEA
jgi:hypothetical protein